MSRSTLSIALGAFLLTLHGGPAAAQDNGREDAPRAPASDAGVATTAPPCPWRDAGSEYLTACTQWDIMAQRMRAAEARAAAAEQTQRALQTLLDSLRQTVDALGLPPAEPAPAEAGAAGNDQARVWQTIDRLLAELLAPFGGGNWHYQLSDAGDGGYLAEFEPTWDGPGARLRFAAPRLSVRPLADGETALAARLGGAVELLPAAASGAESGAALARLTFTDHALSGVWSNTLPGLRQLDLALSKLQLDGRRVAGVLRGDGLQADYRLTVDERRRWRQQTSARLQTWWQTASPSFSLGRAELTLDWSGTDYRRWRSHGGEVWQQALAQQPLLGALLRVLGVELSRLRLDLTLDDLNIDRLALAELRLASHLAPNQNRRRLLTDLEFAGLDATELVVPLRPRQGRLRLEASLATDVAAGLNDSAAPAELLAALQTAGTRLRIEDSFIATDNARFDFQAALEGDPQAPLGATGRLQLQVAGLDRLLAAADDHAGTALAPLLALLSAFSSRSETDGRTLDTFTLTADRSGRVLLNGKDISAMLPAR